MTCYTLLADDNCPVSYNRQMQSTFRAHVIYNILTNGKIVFSDNQLMASANLRYALREEPIFSQSVKDQRIIFKVREEAGRGSPTPLPEIYQAFADYRKIRPDLLDEGYTAELAMVEEYGVKESWHYDRISDGFKTGVLAILDASFYPTLPDRHVDLVKNLIAEETERNGGVLGRVFLQTENHLPSLLDRYGVLEFQEATRRLIELSDAVYLSNLPRSYDLEPIYAPEHRRSFEILRAAEVRHEKVGDPTNLKSRLKARHFEAGLTRLTVEDIDFVHQSSAYQRYRQLLASGVDERSHDEIVAAYGYLNMLIEDRIIARFPEVCGGLDDIHPRLLQKQVATVVRNGVPIASDVISVTMNWVGNAFLPMFGTAVQLLFDTVRQKATEKYASVLASEVDPYDRMDEARAWLRRDRLEDHLHQQGQAKKVEITREIFDTDSFARETMVM